MWIQPVTGVIVDAAPIGAASRVARRCEASPAGSAGPAREPTFAGEMGGRSGAGAIAGLRARRISFGRRSGRGSLLRQKSFRGLRGRSPSCRARPERRQRWRRLGVVEVALSGGDGAAPLFAVAEHATAEKAEAHAEIIGFATLISSPTWLRLSSELPAYPPQLKCNSRAASRSVAVSPYRRICRRCRSRRWSSVARRRRLLEGDVLTTAPGSSPAFACGSTATLGSVAEEPPTRRSHPDRPSIHGGVAHGLRPDVDRSSTHLAMSVECRPLLSNSSQHERAERAAWPPRRSAVFTAADPASVAGRSRGTGNRSRRSTRAERRTTQDIIHCTPPPRSSTYAPRTARVARPRAPMTSFSAPSQIARAGAVGSGTPTRPRDCPPSRARSTSTRGRMRARPTSRRATTAARRSPTTHATRSRRAGVALRRRRRRRRTAPPGHPARARIASRTAAGHESAAARQPKARAPPLLTPLPPAAPPDASKRLDAARASSQRLLRGAGRRGGGGRRRGDARGRAAATRGGARRGARRRPRRHRRRRHAAWPDAELYSSDHSPASAPSCAPPPPIPPPREPTAPRAPAAVDPESEEGASEGGGGRGLARRRRPRGQAIRGAAAGGAAGGDGGAPPPLEQ